MALSLEFAFEGFRILRRRPRLLVLWGVVTLLGHGLAAVLFVALSGAPIESLIHLGLTGDVATIERLAAQAAPGMLAGRLVILVTTAIVTAAICRVAFGDSEDGLGFLQFGPRELQLIAVQLATQVVILIPAAACLAVIGLPALFLRDDTVTAFSLAVGIGAAAAIALWLDVRLMFNSAQSFAEQRLAVLDSFVLTREPFWTLLAGRLLSWVLALVVLFLSGQAIAGLVAFVFGTESAHPSTPDLTSLHAFFTPDTLLSLTLTYLLVSPQVLAISLGAPIAAWRAVTGQDAAEEAGEII